MSLLHVRFGDGGFFKECLGTDPCITPGVYAMIGAAAVLTGDRMSAPLGGLTGGQV